MQHTHVLAWRGPAHQKADAHRQQHGDDREEEEGHEQDDEGGQEPQARAAGPELAARPWPSAVQRAACGTGQTRHTCYSYLGEEGGDNAAQATQ